MNKEKNIAKQQKTKMKSPLLNTIHLPWLHVVLQGGFLFLERLRRVHTRTGKIKTTVLKEINMVSLAISAGQIYSIFMHHTAVIEKIDHLSPILFFGKMMIGENLDEAVAREKTTSSAETSQTSGIYTNYKIKQYLISCISDNTLDLYSHHIIVVCLLVQFWFFFSVMHSN